VIEDCEAVVALWLEAGLTRPWNDPYADFKLALGGPMSTVMVATENGVITGSVMIGFDGHRGWVYYLSIATNSRGSGLT
jgi:hypothetical protein